MRSQSEENPYRCHHRLVLIMTSAAAEEKRRDIVQTYMGRTQFWWTSVYSCVKFLRRRWRISPLSSLWNWTVIDTWQLFCQEEEFFFTSKLDLNLRKKLVKCYIWSIALYDAETWILREVVRKYHENLEKWRRREMEKIGWSDLRKMKRQYV
jgi:hypothetical protein